jgi:hypothetical protein
MNGARRQEPRRTGTSASGYGTIVPEYQLQIFDLLFTSLVSPSRRVIRFVLESGPQAPGGQPDHQPGRDGGQGGTRYTRRRWPSVAAARMAISIMAPGSGFWWLPNRYPLTTPALASSR